VFVLHLDAVATDVRFVHYEATLVEPTTVRSGSVALAG
jgi:hypothetical protein